MTSLSDISFRGSFAPPIAPPTDPLPDSGMFKLLKYVVGNMEICSVTPKYGGEDPPSKPLYLPTNETNDIIPLELDSSLTMTMAYVGHRR